MKGRGLAPLLASLLWLAAPAAAEGERDLLLRDAIETYTRALDTEERDPRLAGFRRAEHLFARVAADGAHNAELFTNLGNAALLAEDLGGAVLAYRRALAVDPDHARALQNLEHARALLPEWVPRPEAGGLWDSFFFWHRSLPRATRVRASALCFTAAALLVAAGIRWRQTSLRNAALVPALAWLGLVGSVSFAGGESRSEAVITA